MGFFILLDETVARAGTLDRMCGSSRFLVVGFAIEFIVVMVPCLTGLSAPHWRSGARAAVFGLGLDSTRGHLARALLDGIACSCAVDGPIVTPFTGAYRVVEGGWRPRRSGGTKAPS